MNNEVIHAMTENFENHAQKTDSGIEFWMARDVQHLLGYGKWSNLRERGLGYVVFNAV